MSLAGTCSRLTGMSSSHSSVSVAITPVTPYVEPCNVMRSVWRNPSFPCLVKHMALA